MNYVLTFKIITSGEPLNEEVINAWHEKTGLWIREGYGQTETTLIAATSKDMTIKPGSMGKAAPGNFNFWCIKQVEICTFIQKVPGPCRVYPFFTNTFFGTYRVERKEWPPYNTKYGLFLIVL